ncbi:lytic polysaccharide monooxygenase [Streptomyces sp. CHD11]|uniref:lytic polysaccharide monooxygenase auxiliary activity family 9 protein n=1 Tax=Streptomyces sp. CHD11 TaxID=2741325 RepID=UPI001BFC7F4F|nr:lytic polysaccharide monooxygenase [Streptomyces sp. CHD11]MBT3149978.1 lytic polysaccharide monooxygenase [Streptomyces sp. CHD11]
MPRTTAHRTALAAALVTPLLLPLWSAGQARAHGAPTDPVSRVVACSPEGGARTGSAACRAAVAANGAPFTAWDNLRVADVAGRDRQRIPDGQLCSGGLPAYRGLDLARADWPATPVGPGAALPMTYVSTIPHSGTFRMYLTRPGYDPAKPLTWSDLPERPFAEVAEPALTDGAYRFRVTLPADRSGRHVLYTVWQNSSTPDTYYSCSDVVFPQGEKAAAAPAGSKPEAERQKDGKTAAERPSAPPAQSPPAPATSARNTPSPRTSEPASTPAARTASAASSGPSAPLLAGGALAVLVLTGATALALRLRRR